MRLGHLRSSIEEMANVFNPQLTISTDAEHDSASVTATCGVELTEFERNAMKLLDLKYTLECRVLNKDLQYEATVLEYDSQSVPSDLPQVHMTFTATTTMSGLHNHVFTRDELIAEFTLTNGETGSQETVRSATLTADLAG